MLALGLDIRSHRDPGAVNDCLVAGFRQLLPGEDNIRIPPDDFLVFLVEPRPVFRVSAGFRCDTPQGIAAMNNQGFCLVFRDVALDNRRDRRKSRVGSLRRIGDYYRVCCCRGEDHSQCRCRGCHSRSDQSYGTLGFTMLPSA